MKYIAICPAIGFIVAAAATKAAIALAERQHLYDAPGPLKIHQQPTPRLGGIGIASGLLVAALPWFVTSGKSVMMAGFLLLAIWALGLVDDLRNLPAIFRLCLQLGVGTSLGLAGWELHFTRVHPLDLVLTALVFALFVNAMNLLDGMDGLATGTAAIAATGFVILSPAGSTVALFAACLLGACLGTLVFNFPPARIFIGDSGSTLLGALLFFLTVDVTHPSSGSQPATVGFLILAIPLLDTLFAAVRRILGGGSPFRGDRLHFYDLLLARGLSVRRVLLISYTLGIALVVLSALCARGILKLGVTGLVVLTCLVFAGFLLGSYAPQVDESAAPRTVAALGEKPTAEI